MGRACSVKVLEKSTQERKEEVYGKTLQCEGIGKIYPREGKKQAMVRPCSAKALEKSTQERKEEVYGKTLQCEGVGKIYPREEKSKLW